MYWSKVFIPTLRDAGQRTLIRAGYARESGHLYLGTRSLHKIAGIIREEMGGQEVLLAAPFLESAISVASHDLRSYKQLPQTWSQTDGAVYQSCSFELDGSDCLKDCQRVLDRCGVNYVTLRHELVVPSERGDQLVTHESNVKRARSVPKPPVLADAEGELLPEEFHTPGLKTIADICAFTGLPESSQIKSLVMVADGAPVLILLRGDHTLNEYKFKGRQATPDEIRRWFGADPRSLGPVRVNHMRILADEALRGRRNLICGANRNDYHLRNVTPGKDFQADFLDLRMVAEGDTSLVDGAPLHFERAFTLAEFERREGDLHVSNESGKEVAVHVSSCRFFLDQVLIAAAEQQSDADGLALASTIAPFGVVITPVHLKDAAQDQAARTLHEELAALDPLLDDRDERPGVKFKDADLIGIPFRVTVGKKLAQGLVEVVNRRTRETSDVEIDRVAAFLMEKL
jgi:prolyl-tRNA synthetase